jgi:RNA polymerase sigma-70 factor (ECF subfamily)
MTDTVLLAARPDEELVARILGGDRELYAVLVRRYEAKLYRHALGMLQDRDAATDLVQDSFVKAYASLSTCHDPARFGGWIFRILRNRCTDYLKEHRRRDVSLESDDRFASERYHPLRDLERAELRGAVEQALAALPEPQREAFLLKHVEGLSYEEMAEMLGAGVSALKMRVARAREALRATLEGLGWSSERNV